MNKSNKIVIASFILFGVLLSFITAFFVYDTITTVNHNNYYEGTVSKAGIVNTYKTKETRTYRRKGKRKTKTYEVTKHKQDITVSYNGKTKDFYEIDCGKSGYSVGDTVSVCVYPSGTVEMKSKVADFVVPIGFVGFVIIYWIMVFVFVKAGSKLSKSN